MNNRATRRPASTGVLLVDKPQGITSHDAVARVRRIFGQREVGHTGTLDPMATGLLVLGLGKATRIARFIEATEKEYVGVVTLGRATTTYDAEGETTAEGDWSRVTSEDIERVLATLTGKIAQTVPAFSAVKVDGERLYAKARRGEEVEAPTREVTIHRLVATKIALPEITLEVTVSKGTYIRTLAVQIGDALQVPAHLSMLRRTRVGSYEVVRAHQLETLRGEPDELIPLHASLPNIPRIVLDARMATDVRHGRPLVVADVRGHIEGALGEDRTVRLLTDAGDLLAIANVSTDLEALQPGERGLAYACVLGAP